MGRGFLYVRFALVRSGDGEFHPFRDVGRVVTDTLKVLCDHENIEHALAVRGVLRDFRDEVLLMDEPTSALDPISTAKIEDLVLELKKDYTIVMVTHNMQQATRVSDTTAFFLLGDMIEADDTEKLFSTPRDKRTEDYITGRFG